jgi:hypothetical protein
MAFAVPLSFGICPASGGAQPNSIAPETLSAPTKSQDPLHRESSRSSAYSFLQAGHAKNYQEARRYIDFRNAPPEQRSKDGPKLAQQLERILDHDARFDVASLSGSTEGGRADRRAPILARADSFQLNGREVQLELEHVTLHSGLAVWLFSPASIELIPQLAGLVSGSPIERHLPPPLVDWTPLDTPVWRWMALAVLAAVLSPLSLLISRPVLLLAERLSKRIAPIWIGPYRGCLQGRAVCFCA